MTTYAEPAHESDSRDQAMFDLAERFNDCFVTLAPGEDLFTPDAFFDLLPPQWRFQLVGPAALAVQLAEISEGPTSVVVVRTVPTATGFVTEHVASQETPTGVVTARRLCLCEVEDGRITSTSVFCNGPWDAELRARHADTAPMLRP